MDLPAVESERLARPRRGRHGAVTAMVAFLMVGLVGVTATALVGHDTRRVVAVSTGAHHSARLIARTPATTMSTTPVSTTQVTVAATAPSVSIPPSATRFVPPPTVATNPPATSPPTTAPVSPGQLQLTPSTANFASTPPPYSPMPIVSITITNTGGVAVGSVVVHPVGVYSVPSSTCSMLMPGQSCVAQIQFCPSSPSHYVNTLTVTGQDTHTGVPLQASITLNGTAT